MEFLLDAPQTIVYGGPPLGMKVPLKPTQHVIGTIDRFVPHPIPDKMLEWIEDEATEGRGDNILYVSLGTKYELTEYTCTILVALLKSMVADLKIRVLWSLREPQQKKLKEILPAELQGRTIRIEKFTPQPEVLAHKNVKVFLSHCGWGGVTDATAVGVPILGFPGMQDQFTNARMVEEAGAGILLADDFSNLVESTKRVLKNHAEYQKKSKAAGDALREYGGLERTIQIIESVADGKDPSKTEDATRRKIREMMNEIDPFFEVPQVMEQWASAAIFSVLLGIVPLLSLFCCVRCCCWCCCGGRKRRKMDSDEKKEQ